MKKQPQKKTKEIYLNRVKCDCVAQKHELINNCLGCGKVVCAQQGQGPCLYCGRTVTRPDTTLIISTENENLFPTLPKEQQQKMSQERSKAILHTNKLVERDRSTNITQNIIDQQMDYYDVSQNQWLSEQDRQQAIDKILEKSRFIETQQFKVKGRINPLTGQFQREQFSYDEQSFKKQGQKFIEEKQKEQFNKRMQQKTKSQIDDRVLKNDKLKDLCKDIISQQKVLPENFLQKKHELEKKKKVTELILDEQENTEVQQA